MTCRQVLLSQSADGLELVQRRFHHAGIKGRLFHEKIPGAVFDRIDRIFDVAMTGQHEYVDIGLMFGDPLQHRPPIHAGHPQIRNHAIERCGLQGVDAGLALFHGSDLAVFLTQGLFEHHADIFFVVDDERAHRVRFQLSAFSCQLVSDQKQRADG